MRTVLVRRPKEVNYERVRWWGEADEAVVRAMRAALGFDPSEDFDVIDEATMKTTKLTAIKDGAKLTARRPSFFSELRALIAFETSDAPVDFQRDYVKLERVLSHLASERTTLAWIRAALTLLLQALALWKARTLSSRRLRVYLDATTLLYFLLVPLLLAATVARHIHMKRILKWENAQVKRVLSATSFVALQAALILAVCAAAAFTFVVVGADDTLYADFRPANLLEV